MEATMKILALGSMVFALIAGLPETSHAQDVYYSGYAYPQVSSGYVYQYQYWPQSYLIIPVEIKFEVPKDDGYSGAKPSSDLKGIQDSLNSISGELRTLNSEIATFKKDLKDLDKRLDYIESLLRNAGVAIPGGAAPGGAAPGGGEPGGGEPGGSEPRSN
jgi:hypothetical protein